MLSISDKTLWYIHEVWVLCIVLIFCWVSFVLLLALCDRPPKRCVASRTDQSKLFLWTCSPRPNIVNLSFCLKEIPVPSKQICWTSSSTFQMYGMYVEMYVCEIEEDIQEYTGYTCTERHKLCTQVVQQTDSPDWQHC